MNSQHIVAQLEVTQTRSLISEPAKIRRVVRGLGLGRIGKTVTVANTPSFRGMVKKVLHLVSVVEIKDGKQKVVGES
jgi:large subunit ribosomal protein L30